MVNPTPEQVRAAIIVIAVGQAIRALGEVPSGELYAQLMGRLSLNEYNAIIRKLKDAKMITETNYLLKWVGP